MPPCQVVSQPHSCDMRGAASPHRHRGPSPGELCWWWPGWGLAVPSYNRQQMGGFTPFVGVEVIAPGSFPIRIYTCLVQLMHACFVREDSS